jgi:DNA-binding transcriptional MerR regulator
MSKPITLKDVSRILKIRPYRIAYAISIGAVPEPAKRFGNARIFEAKDIKTLAAHFKVEFSTGEPAAKATT